MKKLFIILLMSILLVSFTSAFEFDNVKNNKGDGPMGYQNIEIKNAFGLGTTLFEGSITEHTFTCSSGCLSKIEINHSGGVLIDELIFYTIINGERIPQDVRSYNLKYEAELPRYETKCEITGQYQNGSEIHECNTYQSGTYGGFKNYNVGEELPEGNYELYLEAKKKPSRSVDWVISTHGETLTEWAVWGNISLGDDAEVLLNSPADGTVLLISNAQFNCSANVTGGANIVNISLYTNESGTWEGKNVSILSEAIDGDGLVSYYKLDDPGGSINDSMGFQNGSYNGALYSRTGIINTSIGFDGTDDKITYSSSWIDIDNNYTVSMWANFSSLATAPGLLTDNVASKGTSFYADPTGAIVIRVQDAVALRWITDQTPITTGQWYHVVATKASGASTEPKVYVNGTLLTLSPLTNSPAPDGIFIGLMGAQEMAGEIDEVAIYNRTLNISEISDLYNSGSANRPTAEKPSTTQTWNRSINQSTLWTCEACDSDGDCGFATENRTVTADILNPIISVESPNSTLIYNFIGNNETLNVTFTDEGLDTCWYNYNGTNVTIDGCLTTVKNSTVFILEDNNFNMTLYANDSSDNLGSEIVEWGYNVLEINQTFNNMTTEGATEMFEINIVKDSSVQISTIDLIYNGTSNSFPYSVDGNNVVSKSTITIPIVSSDVNVSFYWNITLDNGNSISTRLNNQSILSINVDDCSSFTNIIYNFTQYDEENQSILSGNNTIELQINLYDTAKTTLLTNFSNKFNGVNPVQFCSDAEIIETVNYSSYVTVKYFANSTSLNETYSVEYYHILNQTLNNDSVPINIALYNLKADDTTKFRLTFRDDEYVLAPNILVQVHRQYIKDNDFKIVEIPLTDSNGQTMLNLVKDTIIYNFIMVNEAGDVIGTFNSIKAFCQDFTIGDCTINLAPDSSSENMYDYNDEFDISFSALSYDNSTEKISMSFVTGDLTAKNVKIEIVRNNDFGNRSVCSDSLFAASGLLSCDVSSIVDTDQFLFTSTFVEGDLAKQDTTNLNGDVLNFGTLNGAFYAFLFILFLITMFMEDRKVLVVSLGLGWVGVISLGLVNGKFIGFTSAGIWIIVSIAIFLWKLNSEESA